MGIDVDIRIVAPPTPDLVRRFQSLLDEASHPILHRVHLVDESSELWLRDVAGFDFQPHIHVSSWMRFYGSSYRRGNWPEIRAALFAIREIGPPGSVYYGGDYKEWHVPTNDGLFAELDAAWEKYGADY